ncbi:hypothetical protein ES703_74683 [subsurface metagenome]
MKHWFPPGRFLPRDIEKDPSWQRFPESHRRVLRDICWHSYLVKRSPTRRYCQWTYGQIAERVGLSRVQVGRIMRRLMEARLIYRWYAGDSGENTPDGRPKPPRYELPASRGMINWWKRVRKWLKVKAKAKKSRLKIRGGGSEREETSRVLSRLVSPEGSRSPPGPNSET